MCEVVNLPGGATAILCRGHSNAPRCSAPGCGRRGTTLCDHPVESECRGATCNRPVCVKHARHVGPDTDWCDVHGKLWDGRTVDRKAPCPA